MFSPKTATEILYGKNAVVEVVRAGRRKIFEVYVQRVGVSHRAHPHDRGELSLHEKFSKIPQCICDKKELFSLTKTEHHQGIAVRVSAFAFSDLEDSLSSCGEAALFLALDSIQDPQNFGALCRSALAFGVDRILLPKDRSVTVTPAVCKASAGAVEHLKIIPVTNLNSVFQKLKEHGFWIYGTALTKEATDLSRVDFANRSVLVLGSEEKGLRPLVAKNCDVLVKIPMKGDFDSLNVAQAGTICLYEITRKTFSV